MGEVINVAFGTEREWELTRDRIVAGLVVVGGLFGDSEALMRAKAEVVHQVLRRMVDESPSIQFHARLPDDLTRAQITMIMQTVKEAVLQGVESAMTHCLDCLMEDLYDIATSKLSGVTK